MKIPATIATLGLAASLVAGGWLAFDFFRETRAHEQRVRSDSRVVTTACGRVEVAESGNPQGRPLLVIHGSGGGFDQGLLLGEDYAARGYRVIAPSRFGYLRTPFPADPSGERQADHFACLLDALAVPEAGVMGVSAGGISALHFAVRHPARTRALILIVPAVYRPDPALPTPAWALRVLDAALVSDFPFWLMARGMPEAARRLVLATPAEVYAKASARERQRADAMLDRILPVSARRLGLMNDSRLTTRAARAALESIRAPTLCVSAEDDGYGTYASARYSAEHIAGARFLGFETGGHLLLEHQSEVVAAADALLREAWMPRPDR